MFRHLDNTIPLLHKLALMYDANMIACSVTVSLASRLAGIDTVYEDITVLCNRFKMVLRDWGICLLFVQNERLGKFNLAHRLSLIQYFLSKIEIRMAFKKENKKRLRP